MTAVVKLPSLLTEALLDRDFVRQVEPDWKKLATCIQCGTCSVSCPAAELMDFAPRQIWELVRLGLWDQVVNNRTFWLCTQCYACQVRCPRGILIGDTMRNLREWAVEHDCHIPAPILQLRDAIAATHNILNEDNQSRLIWRENLGSAMDQVQDACQEPVELLLFTGCVSSFYPMAYSIPQSFIQILKQANVACAAMGGEEWCCGYPLYGAGMKDEMAELVKHNIEHVQAVGAQTLVITCPSCYHTWLHLYPEYNNGISDFGFEVVHASQFLADLIEQGRITMTELPWVVTYHDPCDLGRKSGVYQAPRSIIEAIPGMELREMAHSHQDALCCGGGGDVAMMEEDVTEHIAKRRLAQAVDTGASAIISSCQQCKRTLLQAARKTKTRIRVLDVTELVWQAMEK